MEGPIARILVRSLARLSKQSRSGAFSATQRRCLWSTNDSLGCQAKSNFTPTLVSTRNFSRDNGDCNKTDVANSEKTLPIDGSKPEVPMEQAPQAPVVKPFDSSYEESTIEIHTDRLPEVRLTNKPFLKQIFAGVFDTDMLTYPEMENNKELEELENFVKPYEELFSSASAINFTANDQVPIEFITAMADIGLFAQAIPKQYGGLELSSTYLTRMADITGTIPMAHNLIEVHHNLATQLIVKHGTPEQKQKYLPKLATGEMLATLCLQETKSQLDFRNTKTLANVIVDSNPENDGINLTGYKTWVANAHISDIFLVVAHAPIDVVGRWKDEGVSMFIVEATEPGVKVSERLEGIKSPRSLPLFDVSFNNVSLNETHLLGKGGEADLMVINAMTASAHHAAAAMAALLKRFTNTLIYYLTSEKVDDVQLFENQSHQAILASVQRTAYVMESMAYMTGQIADEYQEPDLSVEQAATRVWCVENLHSTLASVMEVIGVAALEKHHPLINAFIDTLAMRSYPIPMDLMRQYISLSGVRHTVGEKGTVHRTMRDSLNNPAAFFKRVLSMDDVPSVKVLHRHVHDILHISATKLEDVCQKFDKAVENYLIAGPASGSFLQDQFELDRLARIASEIYAMTCAISHASRSICLGVRYHNHESVMAQHFVAETCKKVEIEIEKIHHRGNAGSLYYEQMAKDIVEAKEYMPRHPLTRSY